MPHMRRLIFIVIVTGAGACLLAWPGVARNWRPLRPAVAHRRLLHAEIPLRKLPGMGFARPERIAIRVEKSRRVLTLLYAGAPVKEYPVALGRNPVDDKR